MCACNRKKKSNPARTSAAKTADRVAPRRAQRARPASPKAPES